MINYISEQELEQNIENCIIVDARTELEYTSGHVLNAVNLPIDPNLMDKAGNLINMFEWAAIMSRMGISNTDTIIVYDNGAGKFAARFWYAAKYYGHQNIAILEGGFHEIKNLKITTELPNRQHTYYEPLATPGYMCFLLETLQNFELLKFVDTRSNEEWSGQLSAGNPRVGRIPGAVHLNYERLIEGAYLKQPTEIREIAEGVGLLPEDTLVLYCQLGARATLAGMALREAGYQNVWVYDGSMYEWSRHKALALEV
ncbi:MAG: rhodanese-like domain-containing protein [Defluviitaleaceae bacterium]|nr:rhodanese-like domain-containing protein [Defluviitaleaceae bacterium]